MYRLLIVDDEPHVVDWLEDLFGNLDGLPFEVYKAYTAKAALEWLHRTRMDIVLTDISMPRMSGLDLMRAIRSSWPECKVVFLTGHNNFDYAYEAIRGEASGYVLKTESDREIVGAVEKAVRQIEESLRIRQLMEKNRAQLDQALPLMRKDFMTALLTGRYGGCPPEKTVLQHLGIALDPGRPVRLLLGRRESPVPTCRADSDDRLSFGIDVVAGRFLGAALSGFFSPIGHMHMLWLLQPNARAEGAGDADGTCPGNSGVFLRDTLDTVQSSVRETLGCTVSFAVAMESCPWSRLPAVYAALKEAMDGAADAESVVTDAARGVPQGGETAAEPLLRPGAAERLEACLERGDGAGADAVIEELGRALAPLAGMSAPLALEAYLSLSLKLLSHINRSGLAGLMPVDFGLQGLARPDAHRSWAEAVDHLRRVARAALEARSVRLCGMEEGIVDSVRRYIDEHLDSDVSLVRLAEVVHFNPSYLSRFFKQVTGANLTDYIYSARIGRAKELLARSRVKIHEVASAVGFESSTYFARFFRRHTGLNPQDYRDSLNR